MDKTHTTKIDLSQWITQAKYAELKRMKLGTVSQWVKRTKAGEGKPDKHIEYLDVPELGLTLVKRP